MEMAKGFKELIDEYTEKGVKKGRREVLAELVREGILSAEDAAAYADVNVAEFEMANARTEG